MCIRDRSDSRSVGLSVSRTLGQPDSRSAGLSVRSDARPTYRTRQKALPTLPGPPLPLPSKSPTRNGAHDQRPNRAPPRLSRIRVVAAATVGRSGARPAVTSTSRLPTSPPTAGATPPSRWWGLLAPVHGDWMPGLVPLALIAGVSLLLGSWLRLVQLAKHGQLSIPAVGAVAVLWALPLLLGPPLLSLDAYSYAAQGELLRAGGDPYRVGPEALGGGSALAAVDPFW